jgi:hypothetical protein
MSIVNQDDFKAMWKQRYGQRSVTSTEAYKLRGTDSDALLVEKELTDRIEIGGVYFKVED